MLIDFFTFSLFRTSSDSSDVCEGLKTQYQADNQCVQFEDEVLLSDSFVISDLC